MTKEALLKAVIVGLGWILGYAIALWVGDGLSAITTYAVIAGWWFAAYLASQVSAPLISAIPLGVGYLSIFLAVSGTGRTWLYQDVADLSVGGLLGVGAAQAVAIASPILFDWMFRRVFKDGLARVCGNKTL